MASWLCLDHAINIVVVIEVVTVVVIEVVTVFVIEVVTVVVIIK